MNQAQTHNAPPAPWWKEPLMWMVVGGPLVVVVAGVATFVIAVSNPDPVLIKADYVRDLAKAQKLSGPERVDALITLQPAQQGRNHATSPYVPAESK